MGSPTLELSKVLCKQSSCFLYQSVFNQEIETIPEMWTGKNRISKYRKQPWLLGWRTVNQEGTKNPGKHLLPCPQDWDSDLYGDGVVATGTRRPEVVTKLARGYRPVLGWLRASQVSATGSSACRSAGSHTREPGKEASFSCYDDPAGSLQNPCNKA